MAFNFKDIFFNILLPFILKQGKAELKTLLQKFHDQNPQQYTQVITGAYPLIDLQLENFVKTTGTTVDDDVVVKLKQVLEESAADNGITLQNLDQD